MNEREYVRRPERVTAVQWNKPGDHPDVTEEFDDDGLVGWRWIMTTVGLKASVYPGDWIVERPVAGRCVMSDSMFRRDYEPADDAREGEALRLLGQLVDENPWEDGLTGDTYCRYCPGENLDGRRSHAADCPWVAAKRLMEAESDG